MASAKLVWPKLFLYLNGYRVTIRGRGREVRGEEGGLVVEEIRGEITDMCA